MQNEDCTPSSSNSQLVISYTPRFLVEVHYTFSPKVQWTSKQLKSAYLDFQSFHRRSSKFPAEHLPLLLKWFTPFVISLCTDFPPPCTQATFYRHNSFEFFLYSILGQQLLFKRKHRCVVPIHGHVYRKLKREVFRTEKGLKIAITSTFSRRRWRSRARKEWICERRCQVTVRLHVFAGLFCP